MLKGSFFKLVSTEELSDAPLNPAFTAFRARIRINPEHEIFKGHFPGNPVVPGVCQVQMIREIVEEVTGLAGTLTEADNIKFLSVIVPSDDLMLDLDCKMNLGNKSRVEVSAELKSNGATHLKFKGILCLKQS